jgi:hypothetical protein
VTEPLGVGVGVEEPPDRNGAFPPAERCSASAPAGCGRVAQGRPGGGSFKDGDDSYDFFVIESGAITIVRGLGDENHVIAVHGVHRFLGELNLLSGGRVYLSAVVRDAGEVIQVPVANLRRLVAEDEELSNLILRAYMARRSILIEVGGGVRVIGSRYSVDARRLREFPRAQPRALPLGRPRGGRGGGTWLARPGGCRRPCMEPPRDSTRRPSTPWRSAGRPARRLESRTTSGSRPGSRAAS